MSDQYKDGMIYPPLPKQTEGYHGDYWTADDITGYALNFWNANPAESSGGDAVELVALLKDMRSPYYKADYFIHQRDATRCRCDKCVNERADAAIASGAECQAKEK